MTQTYPAGEPPNRGLIVCNHERVRRWLILLLPFLLQIALGGYINASAVIIWSLICPLGALVFDDPRHAPYWFLGYLALVVISVDVNRVFGELKADLPDYLKLFLSNEWGDFLIHPDASQAFGFDQGRRVLIQDSFADGPWMNLGVDVFVRHVTPERYRPGMGLRPGEASHPIVALMPAL